MLQSLYTQLAHLTEFPNVKWIIAAGVLVQFCLSYFRDQLRILWLVLRLPGPFAMPVIGNATIVMKDNGVIEQMKMGTRDHGDIYRLWVAFFPYVVVINPHHIQKVLSSSRHVEKIYLYRMVHSFLGEGLITSDSGVWKSHRRLIQPSFHLAVLEQFIETFSKGAFSLAAALEALQARATAQPVHLNMATYVNKCILHVMNESVLGLETNLDGADWEHETSPFRQGPPALQYRWRRPWLLLESLYNVTTKAKTENNQKNTFVDFTREVLKARRAAQQSGVFQKKCLLDYLMDIATTGAFTDDDCVKEACTLMLAGQDSVAAAVAFCLHLLANHPEPQQLIVNELRTIFGDEQREATPLDLKKMVYLEQCIKETMRLYPSVPIMGRVLGEDVALDGVVLPRGCEVLISPFATHRLEEYYPDPEAFRPERFDPSTADQRHPFAYIPFSAGPRNCIGFKFAMLEMKTIISTLLRRFELTPVPGKERLQLKFRITMRAAGGVWVGLAPRPDF